MAWYRRGDHDFVLSYSSLPALATLRERVCTPTHGMECICREPRSHSSGGASPQGQQSEHPFQSRPTPPPRRVVEGSPASSYEGVEWRPRCPFHKFATSEIGERL
jgi:hypothetical protein